MSGPAFRPSGGELWARAGELARRHPELMEAARKVRGFADGAAWMHEAMRAAGWRLPPFRDRRRHEARGWIKYGVCTLAALGAGAGGLACGGNVAAAGSAVLAFYACEAQAVFLFPEALRGRRRPWASGRTQVAEAGGTWRVMLTVMPIAARMLAGGLRGRRAAGTWAQGCLAVVLWHRAVSAAERGWVEAEADLPRLEIGPVNPLLLRRERVESGLRGGFRVLWLSDLHWRGGTDAGTLLRILGLARTLRPDACVLGGDFLEGEAARGLFARLVRALARRTACVALPGNHDRGRRREWLRETVKAAGGIWLPDAGAVKLGNAAGETLWIGGAGGLPPPEADARLWCVHDPAEWRAPAEGTADRGVVLAGHLHGGQVVWSGRGGRLLPAAWIYRRAWLRRREGGTEVIVGRGLGDTFPVRWRCPREVILCELR